jgi:hypothetical protein
VSYHESRPSQARKYIEERTTEKFNKNLLTKLKPLTPRFLAIRDSMGLGTEVGFGFLPYSHSVYSMGQLPLLEKDPKDGKLLYPVPNIFGVNYTPLTYEDRKQIVVMPDDQTPTPRIVSIYQRKGWDARGVVEEKLLTAPDEVIEGIIAHEMSHLIRDKTEKPEFVTRFIKQREREIDILALNHDRRLWEQFDETNEAEIDVIASMFGYKHQILAKIDYVIDCLRTYKGANDTSYSLFKSAGSAIEVMQIRAKEVKRYS